jgi:DNA-3-methyladenine glycosylase I
MAFGDETMVHRCDWANKSQSEIEYHDAEWGVPVHDDRLLFEMLTLESAQSGLSWSTILNKRAGYKAAFDDFDVYKIAQYSEAQISTLLQNPNIVRHKLKVNATVNNAKCCIDVQNEYGSFDQFIWSFVGGKPIVNQWKTMADVPVTSPESDAMSKGLKAKGFKFIGSTTCYAYMQGVGMVNDHLIDCFKHKDI